VIGDAEVRRIARRTGVEPRVIDLDYVLSWALHGLASDPALHARLVFKGGTCLRKCYFSGYRFSEDLDFTATGPFEPDAFEHAVREAFRSAQYESGIDFAAQEPRMEVLDDEYGSESVQLRVYYRGPHRSGGSPRAIRLDVSRDEAVVFSPEPRRLIHEYSDADEFGEVTWPCYSLDEMMAEKLRTVLAQRRFAISRDLYDIHRLLRAGVDEARIRAALPAKLEVKNLALAEIPAARMLFRKEEFLADWTHNLIPLVQPDALPKFEEAWQETAEFLRAVLRS
jgi:predicted nucleotidyltransferase component of viral defense system